MSAMRRIDPTRILRWGAGICFTGHGILAMTGKLEFMELLSSFGITGDMATWLLIAIGCLDVLVGLFIILNPTRFVVGWAIGWTTMTIIAWGLHGDTIMDLMRRVPFVAVPAALHVMLFANESVKSEKRSTESGEDAIITMNMDMIIGKLQDPTDGMGWSKQQCEEAVQEYRRFLKLKLLYPNNRVIPNRAIDTVWHYHILDTAAYYKDCHDIFGHILHHYPYLGMNKDNAAEQKQYFDAYAQTKALYKRTFHMSMDAPNYLPSFRRSA